MLSNEADTSLSHPALLKTATLNERIKRLLHARCILQRITFTSSFVLDSTTPMPALRGKRKLGSKHVNCQFWLSILQGFITECLFNKG